MKAFQRFLVVLIVVGLIASYFLWPYFEIRRFAAAVNKKDTDTVKSMTHMEELRASLKKLMIDSMVLGATAQSGSQGDAASVRDKIQSFIETEQGKAMLEKLMTADALAEMLTKNEKAGKQVPMTWQNEQWRSPWEFRVQDVESSGFLIMKITTSGWKVTGLEIAEADLRKFLEKQGRVPAPL